MKDILHQYVAGVDEEYLRRHELRGRHQFAWAFDIAQPDLWQRCPMRGLRRFAHERGVHIVRSAIPPAFGKHTRGFFEKRTNLICIDETLDETEAFHTTLHELGHYLIEPHIEGMKRRGVRYGVSELAAEGVAYVVGRRYLIPTTRASLEYGALLSPPDRSLYTRAVSHAVPEIIRASRILADELERYDNV